MNRQLKIHYVSCTNCVINAIIQSLKFYSNSMNLKKIAKLQKAKHYAISRGGVCLSQEYKNNKEKLLVIASAVGNIIPKKVVGSTAIARMILA